MLSTEPIFVDIKVPFTELMRNGISSVPKRYTVIKINTTKQMHQRFLWFKTLLQFSLFMKGVANFNDTHCFCFVSYIILNAIKETKVSSVDNLTPDM